MFDKNFDNRRYSPLPPLVAMPSRDERAHNRQKSSPLKPSPIKNHTNGVAPGRKRKWTRPISQATNTPEGKISENGYQQKTQEDDASHSETKKVKYSNETTKAKASSENPYHMGYSAPTEEDQDIVFIGESNTMNPAKESGQPDRYMDMRKEGTARIAKMKSKLARKSKKTLIDIIIETRLKLEKAEREAKARDRMANNGDQMRTRARPRRHSYDYLEEAPPQHPESEWARGTAQVEGAEKEDPLLCDVEDSSSVEE